MLHARTHIFGMLDVSVPSKQLWNDQKLMVENWHGPGSKSFFYSTSIRLVFASYRDISSRTSGIKQSTALSAPIFINKIMDAAIVETSSQANNKSCPFLDLPGEIRNEIYSLAMLEGCTISLELIDKDTFRHSYRNKNKVEQAECPARRAVVLALTCKQIHQESLSLFYGNNKFKLENFGELKAFIKAIGEGNARAIRYVAVDNFATTHFHSNLFKPDMSNTSARARLRTLNRLAIRLGWRSVVVTCQFTSTHYFRFARFDLMDLQKDWANPKLDVNNPQVGRRLLARSTSQGGEFVTKLEDEIAAWKELITELHGRGCSLLECEDVKRCVLQVERFAWQ